jgi:polyhydroxyalkanoate synthase
MDLAPGRSFVEYAVAQGFTVFVISWRNPGPEHRDWNLDTYVAAVDEAVRTASRITGSPDASTIGLCAGGLTTAALLGHLAATRDEAIHNAAFAVTLLDFDVPTLIGMLGTPRVIERSTARSAQSGVLEAHKLTVLFSLLRPNDLVWNYWVRNNLLGEEPPAFDVLAWNADATRLPAGLHADFLEIFLHNSLARGQRPVLGTPIDLSKVECDSFVVGALTDHLTGWRACYATSRLLGGHSQFHLSSSGHIQSLVNPPGNPKMTVTSGPEPTDDPDEWLADATTVSGSWWEHWARWQGERGGGRVPAPAEPGSDEFPPLDPAPGTYVLGA